MNFLKHYSLFEDKLSQKPFWTAESRQAALMYLQNNPLPSRKNEDWKYTSLKSVNETDWLPSIAQASHESANIASFVQSKKLSGATNLVFIDGLLEASLSQDLPKNVDISALSVDKLDFVDSLEALNVLFAPIHYKMNINPHAKILEPIHLLFVSTGSGTQNASRVQVVAGADSSSTFLVSQVGSGADYLSSSYFDVVLQKQARLAWVYYQNQSLTATQISTTNFDLAEYAELENMSVSLGGQLARNTLNVRLIGESTQAQVHGAYVVSGKQHVDNNTCIDHQKGHGQTAQLYKGLLAGESRAVFNGKVLIRKNAQKANSEQLNNNLLLSSKAEADSKPMLEIDADDVKATHGSTVGQLNQEELFYLLSRAIPKSQALQMLSYGFVAEVLFKVSDSTLRSFLQKEFTQVFERISSEKL